MEGVGLVLCRVFGSWVVEVDLPAVVLVVLGLDRSPGAISGGFAVEGVEGVVNVELPVLELLVPRMEGVAEVGRVKFLLPALVLVDPASCDEL